ncbi:MAG: hypothetical protein EXR83_13080 [Gammaproteobacteria bacterium]|nr:hypothetical protein [Gammaproteobacteria bacterium]
MGALYALDCDYWCRDCRPSLRCAPQAAGAQLQIFDKGRAPGGRLATRELQLPSGAIGVDHGAQYFAARTPLFQAQCERWRTAGVLAPWRVAEREMVPPSLRPAPAAARLRGVADMRNLAAHCAQGLPLHLHAEVLSLPRRPTGWALQLADGREYSGFDYLLLALPAEQTAALLVGVAPGLSAQAAAARTAPCWAGLFAFTHDHAAKHHAIRGSGEGTLRWLARSAHGPAWVAHATPAWSRAHREQSASWVSATLERALRAILPGLGASVQAVAHR